MLTALQINKARWVEGQGNTLSDGQGLIIWIGPNGIKRWRFRFRYPRLDPRTGKIRMVENTLSFGAYPDVPIATQTLGGVTITGARELAQRARALLAKGIDPATMRDVFRGAGDGANTFSSIAEEWLDKQRSELAGSYVTTIEGRLAKYVFPFLASRSISEISTMEVLAMLRSIEKRGILESARRVQGLCHQIFEFARISGRLTGVNPASGLAKALKSPNTKHFATLTNPKDIAGLIRAVADYRGETQTRIAILFGMLTFVRPGNLRFAEWSEFQNLDDLDHAEWRIPGKKMKVKTEIDFVVPLCRQAIDLLNEIRPLTGQSRFVFPAPRSSKRPMSNNTVNGALRRLGFSKEELTGHGFRAMARTVCHEVLKFQPEVIEEQLGHRKLEVLGGAYDRTTHMDDRRNLMAAWADWLDKIVLENGPQNVG